MTRAAGLLIPILMLAAAVPGKDSEAPDQKPAGPPPAIKRLTIPNPISDVVALGTHVEAESGEPIAKLEGVISVRDAARKLSYAWDPATCRLAVCWKGSDLFSAESDIIYLADGPGPVAASVGAFGTPQYFGYRLIDEGVPEFLYIQGRLGVEESYRIGDDGDSLIQRFRIENGDFGVLISVPSGWREKVKSSAGEWTGNFLKISDDAAKKGFTLTYDLSEPVDLPEFPDGWGNPVSDPADDAPAETDEPFGVLAPPAKANRGFEMESIRIPFPDPDDGISRFELLDDDRIIAVSGAGIFCIGKPGEEKSWRVFADQLGGGASLLEAGSSLLAADSYGITRLFDTDGDGVADFYKAIHPEDSPEAEETEVESREESAPAVPGPEFFESDLRLTGRDPARPYVLEKGDGASPTVFEPLAWIPRSWLGNLSRPAFQPIDESEAGFFSNQIFLSAGDPENKLRMLRIIPEFIGENWQGAVIPIVPGREWSEDFNTPAQAAGRIRVSADGHTLYASAHEPGTILRITRKPGEAPFEIASIRLASDGFEFEFSEPLDRESAATLGCVRVRQGPAGELHDVLLSGDLREPERHVIDADARMLTLQYSDIQPGSIYVFDLGDLRSQAGEPLSETEAIYPVRAVPEKAKMPAPPIEETDPETEPDPFEEVDKADHAPDSKTEPEPDKTDEKPG